MKMIIKPMYFVFSVLLLLTSCNNEELFVEDTAITEPTPETPTTGTDDAGVPERVTTPCDFTLEAVQANATVIINCVMDLGGKTITLPAGVTLVYEGGDIVNGTIKFADNTTISGELLNSTLTLTGTNPIMKDPVFDFIPSRWGIVEGKVSDVVARNNRNVFRNLMLQCKNLGITTFKIDKLDAYFKVDEPTQTAAHGAISVPSNFKLLMTDNTNLRVQPNNFSHTALLTVYENSNVVIDGGNLFGDRDEHDYSLGGTQEWGFVLLLKACNNVTVNNVKINNAGGDGIMVEGLYHAFETNYIASYNILVKNCTVDNSRRNNLSIVDGHDIIVENNTFLNAGQNTVMSKGTEPRYAIDIEPVIGDDRTKPYQKVDRIIIRNNIERNSYNGGFVAYEGNDILFTGNTFEGRVGYNYASNIKIVDNPLLGEVLAGAKDWIGRANNKGTVISGNTIKDVSVGISATNQDIQIFNNNILNCTTGIQLDGLKNANIYNNLISSTKSNSDGFNGLDYVNDVLIENNTVQVARHCLLIDVVNHTPGEENFVFTFKKNTFVSNTQSLLIYSYGINFIENTFKNIIRIDGGKNVSFQSNNFDTEGYACLDFRGDETDNIKLISNVVNHKRGDAFKIVLTTEENKNILVDKNEFTMIEWYSGLILDCNGITVSNNKGWVSKTALIYHRGNNSKFLANSLLVGVNQNLLYDIQGTNNTIN